jgi:hypothetical protein
MNHYRGLNSMAASPPSNSPAESTPVTRSNRLPTQFKVQSSVYKKKPSHVFTVEAKYRKYVSVENSSEGTDTLQFWEVRILYFKGGFRLQLTP